jgi:hypothetical protein
MDSFMVDGNMLSVIKGKKKKLQITLLKIFNVVMWITLISASLYIFGCVATYFFKTPAWHAIKALFPL